MATAPNRIVDRSETAISIRYNDSEARMRLAVAAAFPSTISFLGTYMRSNRPLIVSARYKRPATLAVFEIEFMFPPACARTIRLRSPAQSHAYVRGACECVPVLRVRQPNGCDLRRLTPPSPAPRLRALRTR